MKILLVQPDFPIPPKSRHHKDFLSIGLLKLAAYYRDKRHQVELVNGKKTSSFLPDEINITSLFTYWAEYVWDCVKFYKQNYPKAKIIVGGIYASLMPDHCKMSGCDEVHIGVHREAEKYQPAYDLVKVDYQIIHTSRGCIRKCTFCGVYRLEPKFTYKKSIKQEICSNKLIFYDNNLLANPHVKNILNEIADTKWNGKVIHCESQCGFDGRLLTPELAKMIKKARFEYPKIAWDGPFSDHEAIRKQMDMFFEAGYRKHDISIFMLYNWEFNFHEMEKKRLKCWEWKVQISDCRYRPIDQTYDHYNPKRIQTNKDYYIHPKWTDAQIKQFRRNVRRQNICVRQRVKRYSEDLARKKYKKEGNTRGNIHFWNPGQFTRPECDIMKPASNYFIDRLR